MSKVPKSVRDYFSKLGSRKSPAKCAAARANGSKANAPRHDWASVDWTLTDAAIAERLHCSRARVYAVRKRDFKGTGAV